MDTEHDQKPEWARPAYCCDTHGIRLFADIAHDDIDAVRRHLNAGADPNHREPDPGMSFGPYPIFHARTPAMVDMLVAAGADVNATYRDEWDAHVWTPLLSAASNCESDLVKALLDAGADPTIEDDDGHDVPAALLDFLFDDIGHREWGYAGIMRMIRERADRIRLAAAAGIDDLEDDPVEESAF